MQVGGWILGPVCSDDSIQILLKLAWVITSSIQPVFKDLDGVIRVYIINIIFFVLVLNKFVPPKVLQKFQIQFPDVLSC